jgi:hypothetical protein
MTDPKKDSKRSDSVLLQFADFSHNPIGTRACHRCARVEPTLEAA